MIFIKKNYFLLFCLFGIFLYQTRVYTQEVKANIDKDTIKIGEQISYTITVSLAPEDNITFPEGQTFTPLEMVEAYKIDTTQLQPLKILSKTYALTQFDSGSYTIGKQTLKINDTFVETDVIQVKINDVIVDTTKQKLYPIKSSIEIKKPFEITSWIWWTILALALVTLMIVLVFKLKKKKDHKKKRIPPYQKAIQSLKELDQSSLIDDRNLKEYYSKLTEISRRYLEEKVEIRALEYTSNELINELENKRKTHKINIDKELIVDFKKILLRADLAKFAKKEPDVFTAKQDRDHIETFTHNVQSAIPEPTEEEKKRDQAYQTMLKKRRQRNKWILIVLSIFFIFSISTLGLIATKGYTYVKDAYFGNPSKELLENEWITSKYGFPPLQITTPKVLLRLTNDSLLKVSENQNILDIDSFQDGTVYTDISVSLVNIVFKEGTEFDTNKSLEGILKNLEKQGAFNILHKQENVESLDGTKGIKLSGSFSIKNPITKNQIKKSYEIVLFNIGYNLISVVIIHNEKDQYGDEITNRILNSMEFKLENNQ